MRKKTEDPEAKNIAAVKIDYDRVLLMSVEDGLELMRLVSQAELMKGYDDKNVEFHDYDSAITFKLMSMQEYREKKMDKIIDPPEDK
jgi:hypothetical protein